MTDAELAIVIPTINRADRLAALVDQIHANTATSHRIYLVVELTDRATARAVGDLLTVDVFGNFHSCAAGYNAGFEASVEPKVMLANDDCEFPELWELPALEVLERFPIVGVNEGHGRMTCFAMVRRSYIEEHSGVYDRPSTLCHPYQSQYVDTELAEYAKHRGVWGEAREGGIIHRHWEFGDADRGHANYEKAQRTVAIDQMVYEQRRREWAKS